MKEKKTNQKEIKSTIVDLSAGVKCEIGFDKLSLDKSGQKTEIKYNPIYISFKQNGNKIELKPKDGKKRTRAVLNTTKKNIINAIKGLDKEYVYKLAIVYSHFPMTVKVEGSDIVITNFLGEKRPRKTKILSGCKVEIKGKEIFVKGHDKYKTGQTAGNIEKITRVVGRDFRIFDDGCYIVEKAKQE